MGLISFANQGLVWQGGRNSNQLFPGRQNRRPWKAGLRYPVSEGSPPGRQSAVITLTLQTRGLCHSLSATLVAPTQQPW
jgi:hypothetical protein